MGNCVGRGEGYVLPHDRHKWIAKYGQQVVRGLLDCENSNLLVFQKRSAAATTSFYCYKNIYNGVFDPSLPLATDHKLINPKIVEKLGAERKLPKLGAVVPSQSDEDHVQKAKHKLNESSQPRVARVSSLKEKLRRESFQSSVADLNVYVVTWNMNGKAPGNNFASLLDVSGSYDFFIIGLQETPNFDAECAIVQVLGDKYCLVEAAVLTSLQLFVFAKKSLKSFISGAKVDKIGLRGLSGVMGCQKGAAAVRLQFNRVSMLFITSHFAPHECNFEARNAQYLRICQSMFARSPTSCSCVQPAVISDELDCKVPGVTSNLVEESDVVVWLGDLNYRVELPRSSVQNLINHKLQELWANDQLSRALQEGQVFKGFHEGPLLFPPTYKYDLGTDNYDTSSKERVPSWTDRVLFKVSTIRAELRDYDAISSLKTSDHRPVKAHLALKNLL